MDPITFRFSDLPTELALLVLRYAAQPTFDQAEDMRCQVRDAPRTPAHHIAAKIRNVRVFVQALLVQEAYKKASGDLQFESRGDNLTPAHLLADPRGYALQLSECLLAISLLIPTILAAPSLALSWTSVDFIECLEHAWKSRPATLVNEEHSRPT
ncbi:hypothetical protein EV702DRAFT_1047247 [Suillus placidus]|uniref:Uncharacterized protein n=1 Tax=Suillus placidus TaxID=48579 RepID=A0A9P6ZR47_9AGAM|nr:hypothetical protein EV702DRAFT_1047247 [Suillus placidus]